MYCPSCAANNSNDVKFCRQCGANLTVVVQAMSGHLPLKMVSALDSYLERKHERLRRDSILTGLSGLFLLLSGIWQATHAGGWPAVFMFVGAFVFFLISAWDMLAFKRSQPRAHTTRSLEAHSRELTPIKSSIQASVTEQTTRHLKPPQND